MKETLMMMKVRVDDAHKLTAFNAAVNDLEAIYCRAPNWHARAT
jgi:hypothetical protein